MNKNFAPSFENGSSFQFGNNTPIVQMSTPLPTSLTINFIGRNQELFNADNLASDISILLDGNEVIEEYGETGCPDISGAGAAITQNPGKVEINLTCSNHLIDNSIQATTSMTMQWNAAGEPTPPTMQMLQLRDTKDNITDRFDTPSEGNLNFAAGCFYYDMEADRYACRLPEQVKLEIAPFNSDEFTEISVTEMPEKYFMPGYGGFYSAPLESLTGESSNGWWTARITLRDGDAVQTQTIAPAFFIASTVSAKQIEADGIKVNGNSIEAPEGSIVYDTFGRIRGLSNLDKGIYYIRTTKAIHKVLVK